MDDYFRGSSCRCCRADGVIYRFTCTRRYHYDFQFHPDRGELERRHVHAQYEYLSTLVEQLQRDTW